eukprot:748735-Hanusia_phi.AAC.3
MRLQREVAAGGWGWWGEEWTRGREVKPGVIGWPEQELVALRREEEMKKILSDFAGHEEGTEEQEEGQAEAEADKKGTRGGALDPQMMSNLRDEIEKLLASRFETFLASCPRSPCPPPCPPSFPSFRNSVHPPPLIRALLRANDVHAIDELLQRQDTNQLQEDQLREENRQLREEMRKLQDKPSEVALKRQKQLESDKEKAVQEQTKLAADFAGALCEARGLREELEVLRRNSMQQQQQQQQQHEEHPMTGDLDLDDTEAILQRGDAEELEMQLRLAVSEIMRRRAEAGGRSPGPAKEAERNKDTTMDSADSRRFSGALDSIENHLRTMEEQVSGGAESCTENSEAQADPRCSAWGGAGDERELQIE